MKTFSTSLFNYLLIALLAIVISGCGRGHPPHDNTPDGTPSSEIKLERIDITASSPTTQGVSQLRLAAGNKQPFEAVGYYSDGSSRTLTDLSVSDWHTSDNNAGYFDAPGILTGGDTPDLVTVHASKDGITSNKVDVNVTAAVITEITVTPATVTVAKGQDEPLTATAIYSDGTSSNVTASAIWMLADSTKAKVVPNTGLLSGIEVGETTLTAEKDGIISNTVNVTVTDAVITEITVTSASVKVVKGQTESLTATARYSDGTGSDVTSSVTWISVDTSKATVVSGTGLLTGVEVGNTSLTAVKDGVTSNTVDVTVTSAEMTQITVTPSKVNVAKSQTEPLKATAIYSDGTSSDVTNSVSWVPADTGVATVTTAGVLTGGKISGTTVTATKDDITSNTVDVTVTSAVITEITVTPASVKVAKG